MDVPALGAGGKAGVLKIESNTVTEHAMQSQALARRRVKRRWKAARRKGKALAVRQNRGPGRNRVCDSVRYTENTSTKISMSKL